MGALGNGVIILPAYVWDDQRRPLGHRAALRLADMCYISYIESEPALSPRGVVKRPSLTQLLRVRTDHKEDFLPSRQISVSYSLKVEFVNCEIRSCALARHGPEEAGVLLQGPQHAAHGRLRRADPPDHRRNSLKNLCDSLWRRVFVVKGAPQLHRKTARLEGFKKSKNAGLAPRFSNNWM